MEGLDIDVGFCSIRLPGKSKVKCSIDEMNNRSQKGLFTNFENITFFIKGPSQ